MEKIPPMFDLLKTERETIRFSKEQAGRLAKAAAIVSRRKGEIVETGPLLREVGMPQIDVILASATAAELTQAEADIAAEAQRASA
jgi:membrane protein YdbS with pleckstrin-like domain